MAPLRAVRTAFAAFEACAVDVWRAFRGSWFIGLLLGAYYVWALLLGLAAGAIAYETLEPAIILIGLGLPFPADIGLEIGLLVLVLYAATVIACLLARVLIQGLTYLLFELRGDALFYLLLVGTLGSVLLFMLAAVLPPVISEQALVTTSGAAALAGLMLGTLTVWAYVRYRWMVNPRGREFDRDIGLAWSHMSDPRRARFGFDRQG